MMIRVVVDVQQCQRTDFRLLLLLLVLLPYYYHIGCCCCCCCCLLLLLVLGVVVVHVLLLLLLLVLLLGVVVVRVVTRTLILQVMQTCHRHVQQTFCRDVRHQLSLSLQLLDVVVQTVLQPVYWHEVDSCHDDVLV
jgi:hypothetical protein